MSLPVLLLALQLSRPHAGAHGSGVATPVAAQNGIFGTWKAKDKSVLSVFPCGVTNGEGGDPKVACIRLLEPAAHDGPDPADAENPDPKQQHRPQRFMTVGTGFRVVNPKSAIDGKLYDPDNGKTYGATMTLANNQLKVHGSRFLFFGHTVSCRRVHLTKPSPYKEED